MSEQDKPKNLCEEVIDPAAKDPNWVPPWEDQPVKTNKVTSMRDIEDLKANGSTETDAQGNVTEISGGVYAMAEKIMQSAEGSRAADEMKMGTFYSETYVEASGQFKPGYGYAFSKEIGITTLGENTAMRFLGLHASDVDLPDPTGFEPGAFYVIHDERKVWFVANEKWNSLDVGENEEFPTVYSWDQIPTLAEKMAKPAEGSTDLSARYENYRASQITGKDIAAVVLQPAYLAANLTIGVKMDVTEPAKNLQEETGLVPQGSIGPVAVSPYAKYDGITDAGEIIPGMLSEIHEKIKVARYLGTHSARHDLPDASNYEDGAFFIIPEEHKFYMVINNAWLPFKAIDGITPIIETTQDAAAFAKKIMGIKTPPVWDGTIVEYSSINEPGIDAAGSDTNMSAYYSEKRVEAGDSKLTEFSTRRLVEALKQDTGLSSAELIANSSVNDAAVLAAVKEVQEDAAALRDSGLLTETGIEGVVEITKTDTGTVLNFGNIEDMQKVTLMANVGVLEHPNHDAIVEMAKTEMPVAEQAPAVQEFTGEEESEKAAVRTLDPANIRHVTVPIPSEQLREYFTNKDIFYLVDYSVSKLKGLPFLNYLTNLNVPADISFASGITYEDYSELMLAYMNQMSITNLAMLNVMAAEMLLFAKGMSYEASPYALPIHSELVRRFIDDNKELVDKWLHFIDSTHVYGLHAIKALKDHYKPETVFEVIEEPDFIGCNVAQLYRIPEFIAYYFSIQGVNFRLSYFKPQFEEFMFKNKRLSYYFRSRNNFAALMFEHLAMGTFKASDIGYGLFGIGVFDPVLGLVEYDGSKNVPKNTEE